MFLMMLASIVAQPGARPGSPPIEVMVLGTYHFGNPGRDKVNVRADDVTVPRRQHELEVLADEIARFRPTRVVVEDERPAPGYAVADYASFSPAALATDRNEITQIGYRIAARVGLASVQGIDERDGPGRPDYFPIDRVETYAKAHGRESEFADVFARAQIAAKQSEAAQATMSIPRLLITYNDPSTPAGGQDIYYSMLGFGRGGDQPGAELNAMWYLRNAKIFAKLIDVARPGDRVLVVYGAGHGYWLRHFAATTPGFASVDVRPYLTRAAVRLEQGEAVPPGRGTPHPKSPR